MEIFRSSRLRLTLVYTIIMSIFLVVLIFVVHKTMDWSMFSEQAQELSDAADSIAEAQAFQIQHPNAAFDENRYYKNSNDRLFFYVFSDDGQLLEFVRASFRIEPLILDVMTPEKLESGKVEVFSYPNETGRITNVMMTAKKFHFANIEQIIYVGKDVTALYSGLQKATYALIFLGVFALVIASVIGYILAGRAILPLKEAYDKQRQFAADASHELRTPLAVVMASADLLLSDPSIQNPFLKEVIDDVKSEVKKMSKLVGDLLLVARSDNNALKVKFQKLDLGKLLSQNVRMMTPLAEKKNIALYGEGFRKVSIVGDEQKIKQLILILVDNAIKYTPNGGKVIVRLEGADERHVIFSVQDSGIGIAPEDKEKIFDRFYRVDKVRSREMGGNGLGLAIAMEILKIHKGKIFVDSEPNVGTKFTVELKIKREDSEIDSAQ